MVQEGVGLKFTLSSEQVYTPSVSFSLHGFRFAADDTVTRGFCRFQVQVLRPSFRHALRREVNSPLIRRIHSDVG